MLFIGILFIIFIGILISIFFIMKFLKNKLYFHPYKNHILPKPSDKIHEKWVEFKNGSKNLKLHAWYYPINEQPVLLFCHGNAGNISNRSLFMKQMMDCNISFFIFDYQGFGKSNGQTFLESIYSDADACYDYLKNELKIKKIIPIGESIGSFAAAKLAKERKCEKLILFAGINSISSVVEKLLPFPLIKWITKGDLDVGKNLKDYNGKTLILHSKNDEIVSYDNALKNLEICGTDKAKFINIARPHNTLKIDWKHVKEFID